MQSLFQNPSTSAPEYFKISGQIRILGSCNGILCLGDVHQRYVILWNPYINLKSNTLPIGVGNYELFTHYGFGYDYVNDKYKLLVAVSDLRGTVTKMYTFGVKDCWTVIMNFPLPHICESNWAGKFVSNTLNWMALKRLRDQWVILSFDLATETYGEVLLPRGDGVKICDPELDVLRDCLCVTLLDSKKACWVVWLMKKYGVQDSWTKLVMIPDFFGIYGQLHPLCILENGVVLLKNLFSTLILYNSNDGSLSYPRISGNLGFRMQIYYESLVSLPC